MPTRNQHKQRGCAYCNRYAVACCGAWIRQAHKECGVTVCEDHQQRINGVVFCRAHQAHGHRLSVTASQLQMDLFGVVPHTLRECHRCYRPAVAEQGGQLVCKHHRKRKQAHAQRRSVVTSPLFERGDFIDF